MIPLLIGVGDCKTPPMPQFPDNGFAGSIIPVPTNPPTGDPFTAGGPSLYETYGLAGGQLHTYDLGCMPDTGSELGTFVANFFQSMTEIQTAVVARLGFHTYEPQSWLGTFDGVVTDVSRGLLHGMFTPLAPLALVVCAIAMALALRKQQASRLVSTLVFVFLAVGIAFTATNGPVKIASLADGVIPEVAGQINSAVSGGGSTPGASAVAPVVDDILYPRWVSATLGCADCDVAEKYGPDLWRATAFTWAETVQARSGQGKYQELLKQKQDLWTTTAEKVKDEYPSNYEYLVGRTAQDRIATTFTTWLMLMPVQLYLLFAFALINAAYLIWRVIVMTAPAWALLGLLPATQGSLPTVLKMLAAAVVNSLAFAASVAVYVTVLSVITNPDNGLNWVLAATLVVGWTVLMWFFTKPFRRLVTLFKGDLVRHGIDSTGDAAGSVWRGTKRTATYLTALRLNDKIREHDEDDDEPTGREPATYRQTFNRPEGQAPLELPAAPTPLALEAARVDAEPAVTVSGRSPRVEVRDDHTIPATPVRAALTSAHHRPEAAADDDPTPRPRLIEPGQMPPDVKELTYDMGDGTFREPTTNRPEADNS